MKIENGAIESISGNGKDVIITVKTLSGDYVNIFLDKIKARKEIIDQIRRASDVPEINCDDPTDHFYGHCGCK